jgi:hypothetical protein
MRLDGTRYKKIPKTTEITKVKDLLIKNAIEAEKLND